MHSRDGIFLDRFSVCDEHRGCRVAMPPLLLDVDKTLLTEDTRSLQYEHLTTIGVQESTIHDDHATNKEQRASVLVLTSAVAELHKYEYF